MLCVQLVQDTTWVDYLHTDSASKVTALIHQSLGHSDMELREFSPIQSKKSKCSKSHISDMFDSMKKNISRLINIKE